MVITIDGATGVGKSTVARAVAEELGFSYVNTGRIYRSLAYSIMIEDRKETERIDILKNINILDLKFKQNILIANGIKDERILQNEEIAAFAAEIGADFNFKKATSEKIILAVGSRSVVVEGRRAGIILFPNANLKVYLRANIEERINRKMNQMPDHTYEWMKNKLEKRDVLVNSVAGVNAYEIDTSYKSVQVIVEEILNQINVIMT